MGEAVVAHFHGGLGDIAMAGTDEFSGLFESDTTEELGQGKAGFGGELAAQVEGGATDGAGELLEGGRLGETFDQDAAGLLDPFTGGALGAGAEEFIARGSEQDQCGDFECLAQEPGGLRGLKRGAMAQAFNQGKQRRRQRFGWQDKAAFLSTVEDGADIRMEMIQAGCEVGAKEIPGELDGEEPVSTAGKTSGAEAGLTVMIDRLAEGIEDAVGTVGGEVGTAFEVEADLDGARVKAGIPGQGAEQVELVPFEAESGIGHPPEQGSPSARNR